MTHARAVHPPDLYPPAVAVSVSAEGRSGVMSEAPVRPAPRPRALTAIGKLTPRQRWNAARVPMASRGGYGRAIGRRPETFPYDEKNTHAAVFIQAR
ncbi:hypothetical protein GPX89_06750 [Nocardia sp. ET3-3]|uniref:Uncharacterized protein n=1 Tax=Nocardia terrae TaxID=2675851 RepID=A0A7K1URG6_9NOCA|nr:hypothetical protein [Nocardia terrae]MVU76943.1 hypothetical protein [Nocardia terrae]